MSVVGIDLGSEFSSVAVAFKGKISMVPNGLSKLSTPTLIGFNDKERLFGEDAVSSFGRNYSNTITQIKRLLGRNYDDPLLSEELLKYNFANICKLENNKIGFSVNSSEGNISLSVEQILCGYLRYLKEFTSLYLEGIPVKDVVISCPSYFDDNQRRSLLLSANLAELNVLRLMNENSAVALQYGLLRELDNNIRRVVFIDIGYSNTQVSIVDFIKGELKVLISECNSNVGGRDFDYCLYDYFRKQFLKEHNIDINNKKKAKIRLLKESNKIKKLLSANKDAILPIECLTEEKDTTLRIDREKFAQISEKYLNDIKETILKAFNELENKINLSKKNKINKIDIHSVELVGGCSRVPIISELILSVMNSICPNIIKLHQTLNGDECVSRGCALMCAMISPNFKVREFQVQDINYWPISVSFSSDEKNGQIIDKLALQRGYPSPCTAKITFKKSKSFDILFKHPESFKHLIKDSISKEIIETKEEIFNYPFLTNRNIGKFNVKLIPFRNNLIEEPFIKVISGLDKNGLLTHPKALLYEKQEKIIEEEKSKENENEKEKEKEKEINNENNESKENKESMNVDSNETEVTQETEETPKTEEINEKENNTKESKKEKKKKKKKTKVHETELIVSGEFYNSISKELFNSMFELESKFVNSDRIKKETDESRNELESYVYDMRSKLEDSHKEYMEESLRNQFLRELDEIEDWLYGEEGESATKSQYLNKLKLLKETGDPILSIKWEDDHRNIRVEKFKKMVFRYQQFVDSKEEKWDHITKEEREKVSKKVNSSDTWLTNLIIKQSKLEKYKKPVIMCSQIDQKMREVFEYCNVIVSKPKPKPKEEETEIKKESEKQETQETQETQENQEKQESPKTQEKDKESMNIDGNNNVNDVE